MKMLKVRKLTFKHPSRFFWQTSLIFGTYICLGVSARALFSVFGHVLWLVTMEFRTVSEPVLYEIYAQGDIARMGKPE